MSRATGSGIAALLKDYRDFAGARLWLAIALMLLGALAEGFGILLLIPLATIAVGAGAGAGAPAGWGRLAGTLSPDQRFLLALALFVAAMAARSALTYARDIRLARLQAGYEASLRRRAAATLAERGWTFASRIGQAGMQSLLLTDVPRAALGISDLQIFAVAASMLLVQLALTLFLSPELTALAVTIMGLGSLSWVRWIRRGTDSGLALVQRSEESAGSGFRLHAGLKAALAQGTVPQFLAEYRSSLDRARFENERFAADVAAARSLAFFASAGAAAVLLFVGYRLLHLPFPVLITALVLFARMSAPAQQLQQSLQRAAAFGPSFAAIGRRLGRLEPGQPEPRHVEPLDWTELRTDNAGFEHQGGLGLRNASLELGRGEWLGVDGASGAGKTTLIDLIAGLLAPTSGRVLVDGRALDAAALARWRAGLAYVGQEGSVFDDSVRGNLLAEGARADDAALWEILDTVGLATRIRAFPSGLDERVGDRGSQLSGGERQRLAIARALLRTPSLLILDEATAALDAAGEAALLERLRALEPRPAAIVIAHRDSTLAHCDSVVSIQHGRLEKPAESRRLDG